METVFVFILQSVVSAFVEKCTSRRIIPHPIQLFRFNSLEISWFQGDLEEIEQDVEEQIQIAIANGEFDNIEG